MGKDFDIPPTMFTLDEVEALAAGARMEEAWGDPVLASSAASALPKITLALPGSRRSDVEQTRLFAPSFHLDSGLNAKVGAQLEILRQAIQKVGAKRGRIFAISAWTGSTRFCIRKKFFANSTAALWRNSSAELAASFVCSKQ